ncbi:MAG: 50S ribosomal protein L18 [Candidatus Micrarchaeota archaeon]|nr:50S ribosomal protein L18 [Candidatus Micrarchaeota archaeon]
MGKATGPKYSVSFRRRRENITDYRARVNLLKSGLPRLVVRKSNKYLLAQIYELSEQGDRVLAQVSAKDLKKYAWLPKCNTPTAYLLGLLLAKKVKTLKGQGEKIDKVILDIGRYTSSKNSNLFAVAKALKDSGIECPLAQEQISDDRIKGVHIAKYAETLDDSTFKSRFSEYLKNQIDVKRLPELFDQVKLKILES